MKRSRARSIPAIRTIALIALMAGIMVVPGGDAGAGGNDPAAEIATGHGATPPPASTSLSTPDGLVTITLHAAQGFEGDTLTFVLQVSGSFSDPINGVMFTAGKDEDLGGSATATSGIDFGGTRRSFTFRDPGMFSIDVPAFEDTAVEGDEYFKVIATNTGAFPPVTFDLRVNGWIIDNDVAAGSALGVGDVIVAEGDTGTTDAVFDVTLTPAAATTVTVEYGTCGVGCHDDATAAFNEDYEITEGTLTFTPGETSQTVTVPVYGDTTVEGDETFYLVLWDAVDATIDDYLGLATILDDDTGGGPPTCDGHQATIWGSGILQGTAGPDVMVGSAGNDDIRGNGGDDVVCGGGGDDTIIGGPGDDVLFGEGGNDLIKGLAGNDTADGGPGDDRIQGNSGVDVLGGGEGNDKLWGGIGPDLMSGGAGNDQIHGNAGGDGLAGGDGTDRIWGDAGNDSILGGAQSDFLYGGIDEDIIEGGPGNDRLFGWTHDDELYGNEGRDQLRGQAGDDLVDGGPDYDYCSVEITMVSCEQPL